MMCRVVLAVLGTVALGGCSGTDESAATVPATSPPPATAGPTMPAMTASPATSSATTSTSTTDVLSLLHPVTSPAPENCGPDVVCAAGWLVDPTPLTESLGVPIEEFRHAVAARGVITRVVEFDGVPVPGQIAQDPPEAPYTEVRTEDGAVVGFVDVPWSLEDAGGPTELVYVLHRVLPMDEFVFVRLATELGFTTRVGARTTTLDDGMVEQSISSFGDQPSDPWCLTIAIEDGMVEHIPEAG